MAPPENRFASASRSFRGMFWSMLLILFAPPLGYLREALGLSRAMSLSLVTLESVYEIMLLVVLWLTGALALIPSAAWLIARLLIYSILGLLTLYLLVRILMMLYLAAQTLRQAADSPPKPQQPQMPASIPAPPRPGPP